MVTLLAVANASDPVSCEVPDDNAPSRAHLDYATCLALSYADPGARYEALERARRADPKRLDALAQQMWLAGTHGLPEATALLAAVRSEAFTDPSLLSGRARLAAQQRDWALAASDLDAFLAQRPDDAYWHLQRAVAAWCLGDRDRTEAEGSLVLPRSRDHSRLQACWLVATVQREQGRADEALELLRRADCRADRRRSEAQLDALWTELEAQLSETFGTSWPPSCKEAL